MPGRPLAFAGTSITMPLVAGAPSDISTWPGDANQPRRDQSETDAGVFLRDGERDARGFGDIGRAGKIGRRIPGQLAHRIGDFGSAAAQRGADVVVARRQAEQAEVSLIVGGVARVLAGGRHAPRAARVARIATR